MNTAFAPLLDYRIKASKTSLSKLNTSGEILLGMFRLSDGRTEPMFVDLGANTSIEYVTNPWDFDMYYHAALGVQSEMHASLSSAPLGLTRVATRSHKLCYDNRQGLHLVPFDRPKDDTQSLCLFNYSHKQSTGVGIEQQMDVMHNATRVSNQLEARVVHLADTFEHGSLLVLLGIDQVARVLHRTKNVIFENVNINKVRDMSVMHNTQYVAQDKPAGRSETSATDVHVSDAPYNTLQAVSRQSTFQLQEGNFRHKRMSQLWTWTQPAMLDCKSSGEMFLDTSVNQSFLKEVSVTGHYFCYAHILDMEIVEPESATKYVLTMGEMFSVAFEIIVASDNTLYTGNQVILDMSTMGFLRVEYVPQIKKVSFWVAIPEANSRYTCTSAIAEQLVHVYKTGVRASALVYTMSIYDSENLELPVLCQKDSDVRQSLVMCRATESEEARHMCHSQTSYEVPSTKLRFGGNISNVRTWSRAISDTEIRRWSRVGNWGNLFDDGTLTNTRQALPGFVSHKSDTSWTLDCRPDIRYTSTALALNNRFGGFRCVARHAFDEKTEIDFLPVFHCHSNYCPDDQPYRCTDNSCVSTVGGCEFLSVASINGDIEHMPCAFIQDVLDDQITSVSAKVNKLHQIGAELPHRIVKDKLQFSMKTPDAIAYDSSISQMTPEIDVTPINFDAVYTIPASSKSTVILHVDPYRDNTAVPFALASTSLFVLDSSTNIMRDANLNSGGSCYKRSSATHRRLHECSNGDLSENCLPMQGHTVKCANVAGLMCRQPKFKLMFAEQDLANTHTMYVYTLLSNLYDMSSAIDTAVIGNFDVQLATRTTSATKYDLSYAAMSLDAQTTRVPLVTMTSPTNNSALYDTLVNSVHYDLIRAKGARNIWTNVFSPVLLETSALQFMPVKIDTLTSTTVKHDYVWTRVQWDEALDAYTPVVGSGALTFFLCQPSFTSSQVMPTAKWISVFYDHFTIEQSVAAIDSSNCNVFAFELPPEHGTVFSDSPQSQLQLTDNQAFEVFARGAPFPVKLDYVCVQTANLCVSYGGVRSKEPDTTNPLDIQRTQSKDAMCLEYATVTKHHLFHFEVDAFEASVSNYRVIHMYANSTGHDNKTQVWWNNCNDEMGAPKDCLTFESSAFTVDEFNSQNSVALEISAIYQNDPLYMAFDSSGITVSTPNSADRKFYRLHNPMFVPCDLTTKRQMFVCTSRCSFVGDVFSIQWFDNNELATPKCLERFFSPYSDTSIGFRNCDADNIRQQLHFRRLSFAKPSGMAQLEFAHFPGSCLYVRQLVGLPFATLAIDYSCDKWLDTRFLRRGIVVDSSDKRLNMTMTTNVLYDTTKRHRDSTYTECKELQTSLIASEVTVQNGYTTGTESSILNRVRQLLQIPYTAQVTIIKDPITVNPRLFKAPKFGCSIQRIMTWDKEQGLMVSKLKVLYTNDQSHVDTKFNSYANRTTAIVWTQPKAYGTESPQTGVNPFPMTIAYSVFENQTSSVFSTFGWSSEENNAGFKQSKLSHFEPVYTVGFSGSSTYSSNVAYVANSMTTGVTVDLKFATEQTQLTPNVTHMPASGLLVGNNWNLMHNASYHIDYLPRLTWQNVQNQTMKRVFEEHLFEANYPSINNVSSIDTCRRMCELTTYCMQVAYNTVTQSCILLDQTNVDVYSNVSARDTVYSFKVDFQVSKSKWELLSQLSQASTNFRHIESKQLFSDVAPSMRIKTITVKPLSHLPVTEIDHVRHTDQYICTCAAVL
jgi:hypothetical protein